MNKNENILNIKGAVLDKNQLENYLQKIATDHILQDYSFKETYPIPRLEENFYIITETYNLLNQHINLGINIHPAGEWILDNYYIVEETVKTIKKELPLKKYINFLGLSSGMHKGYARIYVLAAEIVAYTDNKVDAKNLKWLLKSYQNKKTLSMEEIWNISIFLQISIIENIRQICEKIYLTQLQKYKVESIVERLIENKPKENQKYKNNPKQKTKMLGLDEMKYPFIEYMSYKLKTYGKQTYLFLQVLEEQVEKKGLTVSDVIKKEHFDIAVRKVSMGNCIKSLKDILRINFQEIFESINGVEEILKQDPANIYEKMDYKTKIEYTNKIKEISKKTKTSEIYISKLAINLSKTAKENNTQNEKTTHVGYYLVADGLQELLSKLQNKKVRKISNKTKVNIYTTIIFLIPLIISILLITPLPINNILKIISVLLIYIPIEEITKNIIQYILIKTVSLKKIPKIDIQGNIPEELATFVVIPTIVKDKKKVEDLMKRLEVFYLANKSKNIYFALLGDAALSQKKDEEYDNEVIQAGLDLVEILNNKYKNENIPIFHFMYRKRTWSEGENVYLGWERKRGLLTEFNEYILGHTQNNFKKNTLENYKIPKIKYVITLDADTDLTLNSSFELIGAMAHILNKPILNSKKNLVIDGTALIQPRVGITLKIAFKNLFTKIYAGSGGTDVYSTATSDVYQDSFSEGIFTGKGIYDVEVFSKILTKEIPENTVLSHDLLEGSYLRCFLATDIVLLDGYPSGYLSYSKRNHRWIRGDWQISKWLFKKDKLNKLSKYKILDNMLRSLNDFAIILSLVFFILLSIITNIKIWHFITILLISSAIPTIIDILNNIIFKKQNIEKQKNFSDSIGGLKASIIRGILSISLLPDKAYNAIDAIIRTIYRMTISKKHLLEWTTAEDAEKQAKDDLVSYYKTMLPNSIMATVILLLAILNLKINNIYIYILAGLWYIAPYIMWYISKTKKQIKQLKQTEKDYVKTVAKDTWEYFKQNITKENNYLPPDNYQEDRTPKTVNRTSSTNIGLGLLSVVSASDMGYIKKEEAIDLIEKMINTIIALPKWNGHLYNWYNIKTLEPLIPRYISTVDSGNLIGYLYVLKQFILEENLDSRLKLMLNHIENLINKTDFSHLYNDEIRLLSIGFNVEENKLTDSYYDLLASEARQASLIAIAKKDIPAKNWTSLSRTLTVLNKYKGLISWSGTAFEYLMPNINIEKYEGSLLSESSKFMIMAQKEYAKKLGIPWGISESAFNIKDLNGNYQYKAFGIPWLGLKRGLSDEIVVSSYGSILAITDEPKEVILNLKQLEKQGGYGQYGFYESIDYTPSRLSYGKKSEVVKTYMAHHQGLILLSINNLINNNIIQKRFMKNPEIQAIDILLQEKMPEKMIITKETKEKPQKLIYENNENYTVKVYNKINPNLNNCNVISNEDYTVCLDQYGNGFSKYKNILINRYKSTEEKEQGIQFFIKNIKTKRIWTNNYVKYLSKADKYEVHFAPDQSKIIRRDGDILTTTKITIAPNEPVEIRRLEIENQGKQEETLEITSYLEPIIVKKETDYAHMAFSNLFLSYEYDEKEETMLIKRRRRDKKSKKIYLATNFYTENETISELEYEIDKTRFYDRGNYKLPKMVETGAPLSKTMGLVTDPIIAFKRTIKIKPEQKIALNLLISVGEDKNIVKENLNKYKNNEQIENTFELSKAKAQAEMRYLNLKGEQIEDYQKILSYLLVQNPLKSLYLNKLPKQIYSVKELWKFGISGDNPIILAKIMDMNDIYVIEELIKAYGFFRAKNIKVDLIILDEEKYSYETYIKYAVENVISNNHVDYLRNNGIYIINSNEISKQDKDLLEFRANLTFDAQYGNIKTRLQDLEEEYLETIKNMGEEKTQIINTQDIAVPEISINMENLKYYNEYGGFSQDGTEYIIKINKNKRLPAPWSNILANEKFGTLVTESMGGFTWNENSRLNRLTAWSNNVVKDTPSEIIYLKDNITKKIWSLGLNPKPDDNDYYIIYGFGYTKYIHATEGLIQELDVFVPREERVKINILNLKNTMPKKRNIKLIYYIKDVLAEDEIKSNGNIDITKDDNSNLIIAKNLYAEEFADEKLYVTSNQKILSYTGNKDMFIGEGTLESPKALNEVSLDNENSLGHNSCIAIELEIELEAYENKEITILVGQDKNILDIKNNAYKYSKVQNCKQSLEEVKRYFKELLGTVQVKTPLESMNIILNGWTAYQTIVSRLWGKTGFYQSGGAIGFRDQLQDTLGMKYLDVNLMKQQIIKQSKHQFEQGDVLHWWHEQTKKGIRTRFSDDLLWLPYAVIEYIDFTQDYSILDIETPYLKGELLEEGVDEKYDIYEESEFKETIYKHCIRAIEKSLDFGEHGLPKIGSGDWNDGFSTVGNKGKGESVWLGFFIYDILNRFTPICVKQEDFEKQKRYDEIKQELKKNLNKNGWDGRWYKRAYTDNGEALGSMENEECKIDNISQSWSVISDAGENDKKYISMESLENHLVDKENGIIKLLDPPFEKSKLEPGYIKGYLPGIRENGGQYTHAATWTIIAQTMLGFGDKATEYFRMINPIEHARTKEAAQKYKVEPYVIAADIYGALNLSGKGGWTWYTGSSSWMYKAGIEYILGLKIKGNTLTINPCIPKEWKEYDIKYKYKTSIYNIKIKNPNGKTKNIETLKINGEIQQDKQIHLIDNGKIYDIEAIM